MGRNAVNALMAALIALGSSGRASSEDSKPIEGTYPGGELVRLEVDGRRAYVVCPTKKIDAARRWIWVAPFWLAVNHGGKVEHRMYVEQFLEAGFHVAGVDVGTSCGSPRGADVYQKLYKRLVADHRLNAKARLLGQSNGGLISYAWAIGHPESVDRIGCIYPATDFRSWPGLANVVKFPDPNLGYDLSLEELARRSAEFNPIDNLASLAKAGVKIFHIHGDKDELVPIDANSRTLIEKYTGFGGDAKLEIIPGLGHGGAKFYESESLVRFLLE